MTIGRESISPEHENFETEDDGRGAVYTVQPEEISSYKALRRVIDREFVARDAFVLSTPNYFQVFPSVEGINTHLRSMLFLPSKQWRRGHVCERERATGESQEPGTGKGGGKKHTQRQSKQKERCENRLLSLLFACIYDPGTRDCLLAKGIPPLKLRKEDKNGKYRYVSNFTVVRGFLRHVVTHITAAYASSVRIIHEMAPPSAALLPTTFMLIARTFVMMLERRTQVLEQPGSSQENDSDAQSEAEDYVNRCLAAIRQYLTSWEKRNFTTDNPLKNCLEAVKDDVIYDSAGTLLKAMIRLVPPPRKGPHHHGFRKNVIYANSLPQGVVCELESDEECLMMDFCPRRGPAICTPAAVTACHAYLEALLACVDATETADAEVLDEILEDSSFATIHWKYAMSLADLHRAMAKSSQIKCSDVHSCTETLCATSEFVFNTTQEVARLWAALSRSNVQADAFLNNLNIPKTEEHTATVVELVFGGGIAARVSLERRKLIVPISSKLLSKKGVSVDQPKFVRINRDGRREGDIASQDAEVRGEENGDHSSQERRSVPSALPNGAGAPEGSNGTSPSPDREVEPISASRPNNQVGNKNIPGLRKGLAAVTEIPSDREDLNVANEPDPSPPSRDDHQTCGRGSSNPRLTTRRRGRAQKGGEHSPKKKKRRLTMIQTVQDAQKSGSLPTPGTKRKRKNNKHR